MNGLFNTERFFQVGPIVSEYDRHQAVRAHVLFFRLETIEIKQTKTTRCATQRLRREGFGNRFLTPCGPLAHVLRQPSQPSRLLAKV